MCLIVVGIFFSSHMGLWWVKAELFGGQAYPAVFVCFGRLVGCSLRYSRSFDPRPNVEKCQVKRVEPVRNLMSSQDILSRPC